MDYTYTLEKDIKAGYVRILFADSTRYPKDQSPFRGAEILLGHTFPCYAMMTYLADAECFLEQGSLLPASVDEEHPEINVGRYCDNIGFCWGIWRDVVHARISEESIFPEDTVFVESEFKISFFPRAVLLDILRDYLRACEECCQAHLRWLKHRKYQYTVRYDCDYGHAGLKPRDRNDAALCWITSERESFRMVPLEQLVDRSTCRPFACQFRKDWIIYGLLAEEGCHRFHCLPMKVFLQIAGELDCVEAEYSASPHEKRLKKQWRQVQLSGKMWPMP
jgi:hypothetical protein